MMLEKVQFRIAYESEHFRDFLSHSASDVINHFPAEVEIEKQQKYL